MSIYTEFSQKLLQYGLSFGEKDDIMNHRQNFWKEDKQMSDKTILEQWREIAYNQQADRNQLQRFWANYLISKKAFMSSFFPIRMKW